MVVKKNYIQLLILKDRLDDARKLNDEVLKTQPDDLDAQVYKGEIEIRSGKASDAVNTLQAVLKNDPDNSVAHYQQGLAFDQLGNTNRAESRVARCGSTASRYCGRAPGFGGGRHPPERSLGSGAGSGPDHRDTAGGSGRIPAASGGRNRSQAVLDGG